MLSYSTFFCSFMRLVKFKEVPMAGMNYLDGDIDEPKPRRLLVLLVYLWLCAEKCLCGESTLLTT